MFNEVILTYIFRAHLNSFVFCSREEAVAMETELLRDYGFGRQQLTEMLGHACATAITKVTLYDDSTHNSFSVTACGCVCV